MDPLVLSANAVAWAITYLQTQLDARPEDYTQDVYVDKKLPDVEGTAGPVRRYPRMITVRHDGGPRQDLLHTATRLGINVYAPSDREADDLAAMAEGLLLAVRATDPVEFVNSLAGPSEIQDPSGQARRFLIVEALTRGATP